MASAIATDTQFSRAYRGWLLGVLLVTNALNLADRQSIAVASQAIKLDLHFSDSQMGVIHGIGFAVFYTLMGLPLARMAEHWSRTRIIAACLAVFGSMSALCGTARSFWGLMLPRVGVGIGDAGFGTPVSSLIGDHYPSTRRASAMSILWLGAPLGVVVGSISAGWLAQHVSWRAVFFIIGGAALVVSIIAFLTLREPVRGMSDDLTAKLGPPPPTLAVLGFLFSKRSVIHLLIGCALAAIAMNAIGQFLSMFLQRNFHLGGAATGRVVALIAGAAMASGLLIGGFGMDWAARFDRRWYVWGPALGLTLCAPLFLLGFGQSLLSATILVLMAAHVCMFLYYTPTLAMAQNMVAANMRASSAFLTSLVLGLGGIGLGPTIVGFLSDRFAQAAFAGGVFASACPGSTAPAGSAPALVEACQSASAAGIRHALMAMSLLCLWAAVHYLLAGRTLREDLARQYQPAAGGLAAAARI